ncbi:helix-turn-helix transcriptional regulator [Microbacterium sp. T32]|uniref:helix-turn-helix transcriptional regulator n=3 Tax=Bacteria TaxID=2 RepID=UPI000A8B67DB|nr:helix-turn-helix transcriptional regulator [Microbacterium sp. T32]
MKLQTSSDLARLIKNARVQQNLSQQEVADAVGITRQSLARLERGNGATSFDTVLLILDHLGIHLNVTTDRRSPAPTTVATRGSAQAAANALNERSTPQISSGLRDALRTQILEAHHEIDPALRPRIDLGDFLEQMTAKIDPATVSSLREATRGLTARLAIPGSVLSDPPRAVEADSPTIAETPAEADSDAPGGTE